MTIKLFQILLTQLFFTKVMSSYMQPYSLKPYVARESPPVPQKAYVTDHKAVHQNYPSTYAYPAYKMPEPVVIPVSPRSNPLPEATIPKTVIPKTENLDTIPNKCPGNLDAHVLNNLAIALQLLIVNNIINNPPPEPHQFVSPLAESVVEMAFPSNGKMNIQDVNFQMPNSQFLGTSNFGSDMMSKAMMGLSSVPTSPRAGVTLMSPYDAIANSLPLSDTIGSSFISKRDFQSPYAAIMAADNNKDLFSMADFF